VADARDLAIRPLGLAEIVDRSVALTVRHFRALFVAMLVVQAPALALARLQSSGAVELAGALSDPASAATRLAALWPSLALLLGVLVVLQLMATAAAAAIVAPSLDPRRAAGRPGTGRRVAAVATAALLHVAVLCAAPIVGALPGALLAGRAVSLPTAVAGVAAALAGGLLAFLAALLRLVLAPVAAAVEGAAGPWALARSSALMAPRPGMRLAERPGVRASLVLLATFVLALAVNGVATLPRAVAARLVGDAAPLAMLGAGLPPAIELGLTLFEAVASAALQPFSLVAVAVFYFDRRARREALDAEAWAERLEARA
jgi:hypothetical protein